jgi:predicted 3-demethylubiquinone-9 3-methyltransferase (glyoxalase superfamily)
VTAVQAISPFLWFDTQAEAAARFYVSVFPKSRIRRIVRYGAAGPGPAGSVMTVDFELHGQRFTALNGGPLFRFSEAVSFVVTCRTQAQIDRLWAKLSVGGEPNRCGWLKDRYGLSWQVVPAVLPELLGDEDAAKARRAMQAMLGMGKLDIAALKRSHAGRA